MFFIVAFLYSIPIVSLLLFPLKKRIKFGGVHAFFGRIEWASSFFRDVLLASVLLYVSVYEIVLFAIGVSEFSIWSCAFFFVLLSVWNRFQRRWNLREFIEFIFEKSPLEPGEFFNLYYASISGLPGHFPLVTKKLEAPLDYSDKVGSTSVWPVILGVLNTCTIARLVLMARRWKGPEYCKGLANKMITVWGSRAVMLAQARLEIKGMENLSGISGRTIFVCNHKSFLDFAVVPVAISLAGRLKGDSFCPRYMAARDHFYDNPFLYRVIGMGRAMEAIGTIFVDRKSKKEKATAAVDNAVKAIVDEGADIIMFPQGTRAFGNSDVYGKRMDAGYYTTVPKKKIADERGHIKKGVAYLAFDAAKALVQQGVAVNIVPIGILGTGVVVPSGSIRVQKGVGLKVVFGSPFKLGSDELGVEEIYLKVDDMLKQVSNIHAELKKRLIIDVRKFMSEDEIEKFLVTLNAWRDEQDLIFSIIDCIYSLPAGLWGTQLRQLYQLIVETDSPRERLLEYRKNILCRAIEER